MFTTCRKALSVLLVPALVAYALPRSGSAAVIPHDLDNASMRADDSASAPASRLRAAGLSAAESGARARSLDAVEVAQLDRADLRQRGGDVLIPILAAVGLIAIIVWLVDGDDDDDHDHDDVTVVK